MGSNLDGKTTRRKTDFVILGEETITSLPPHILTNYSTVILGMNVVKVNGIPFLTIISRVIKPESATELQNTKKLQLYQPF